MMRAVFFGTPQLAVPSLEAVAQVAEVVQVVCQPDRPAGRGMKLKPPPVKVRALALGFPVIQPKRLKRAEFAESLRALDADVAVVVAYGRILPQAVLDAPRCGCVNVHASLLPRWRGAGPIQWSIVHGDAETGVCLMQMDAGLDTGPVISMAKTPIGANETAGELGARLAQMGADLLVRDLPQWTAGTLDARPQDDASSTYAPLIAKEDGRVDWSAAAIDIHNRIRGLAPWPGAYTEVEGKMVKIHRAVVIAEDASENLPGTIVEITREQVVVSCGTGRIALLELQMQGKKRMKAADFVAGQRWNAGLRLA